MKILMHSPFYIQHFSTTIIYYQVSRLKRETVWSEEANWCYIK